MEAIRKEIVETAVNYIGMTEVRGNQGWKAEGKFNEKSAKEFEELMIECGWNTGNAWCAFFCELVYRSTLLDNPDKFTQEEWIEAKKAINDMFSAGAVATYNNARRSDKWEVSEIPTPGDVVIWQTYKIVNGKLKAHWSGHAGIVESVLGNQMACIEGNGNSKGGREGIEVVSKQRMIDFDIKKGLVLKGFIKPISVCKEV